MVAQGNEQVRRGFQMHESVYVCRRSDERCVFHCQSAKISQRLGEEPLLCT